MDKPAAPRKRKSSPRRSSPKGRRINPDVAKRISDVMDIMINPDENDGAKLKAKKAQRQEKLVKYNSEIHPQKQYNAMIPDKKLHKARQLTLESLNDYLDVAGLTTKDFLEICMEENAGFSARECVDRQKNPGWTSLGWPNKETETISVYLDYCTDQQAERLEQLIRILLPECYQHLQKILNERNREFGYNDKFAPKYSQTGNYVYETKAENMSDRILEAIRYKAAVDKLPSNYRQDCGIECLVSNMSRMRHYWAFDIRQIQRICNAYGLSPHWVFYGADDRCLLAKKPSTERIANEFCMLDRRTQRFLAKAVELSEMG